VAEVRRRYTADGFMVTIFTDVTERERHAQELNDAVRRYRAVVEDQTELICRFDANYVMTFANGPYDEAFSRDGQTVVGRSVFDLIVDEEAQRQLTEGLANLTPANPFFMDIYHETMSDGEKLWMEWINRALYDENGALKEYQAVGRNVTAERMALEALARSEQHFKQLAESHPVPVMIFDWESGDLMLASPSAAPHFIADASEISGIKGRDLFVSPAEHKAFTEALTQRGVVEQMEVIFRGSAGTDIPVEITARRIEFEGGEAMALGVLDISERKQAEAEISQQREALAQSEKMSAMGSLLASVSHELNNPLSIIVGQSQLMEELAADDRARKRAERIKNAADRCARIVKTFLSMARRKAPTRSPTSINDLIRDGAEIVSYALSSGGVELALDLDADDPLVDADRDQLMQVVVNLMINAQQAMSAQETGRELRIQTQANDTGVSVTFADTGPGVPDELIGRVFEPFFTTKPEGVGTGIGLAVCRSIVDAHGGEIALSNAPEGGARFAITLPASATDASRVAEPAPSETLAKALRVLVVDDEEEIARTVQEILELDGHQIVMAKDGVEALALLENEGFDVILSDLRMPGLDGPGLYAKIVERGLHPIKRIGFMTGDTLNPSARRFLENVDAPLIEKPFQADELRGLLAQM
jgi:PAS domain S-box-containing protein